MQDSRASSSDVRNPSRPAVAIIGIVDDDESVRDSTSSLIRSAGYKTAVFASAEEFLAAEDWPAAAGCLVLDVRMPGMSGLDLQRFLADKARSIPIIFVTAHADEELRVRALTQGAIAFLGKPFSDEVLLDSIRSALALSTT
jgi:FixJ family two-component response regulator